MKKNEIFPFLTLMIATAIGTYSFFDRMLGQTSDGSSHSRAANMASNTAGGETLIQSSQPFQIQSVASSRSSWLRPTAPKHHHWAAPLASRLNAAPSEAEYIPVPMEESIASSAEPAMAELPAWPNEHKVNLFSLNMKILPTQDVASVSLEQELPFNDYNKHQTAAASLGKGMRLSAF